MRHQASDDDKLMAEHQDASTTVLIDSLWCVGMMMYAAAQASMLRTCTAWRGGIVKANLAALGLNASSLGSISRRCVDQRPEGFE